MEGGAAILCILSLLDEPGCKSSVCRSGGEGGGIGEHESTWRPAFNRCPFSFECPLSTALLKNDMQLLTAQWDFPRFGSKKPSQVKN